MCLYVCLSLSLSFYTKCTHKYIYFTFWPFNSHGWLISDLLIDSLFFCDIVINFFLGFHREEGHHVVMNHRKIVLHYLRTWFIFDLLATLPFYIILPYNQQNSINRLIRLGRINQVISALGMITFLELNNAPIRYSKTIVF